MTMQSLTTIFVSFLKIGMFTFGGGYAMLPLIEQELITKRRWIEQKEFLDLLTLAQSVPGPIAVNTSVFVGYKVRGLRGAAAALLGTVTPSFVIILVIAVFFAGIRHNPVVDAAFKGMRPAVVALIIGSIVKRLRHPARTSQQRMGELVSTLDESLSGIKVIKSYNAVDYIKQKFYDLNADLARLTLSMARRQQLASPMSEFLGISAVGVILVFGGSLVFKGSLSPEGFIAFVAMFSQITRPVRTFIDQFANINQGIAAGERIFSIIDAQSEIQDKPGALELNGLKDKIEFRDIHFSYDGSREVIDGISFEIRRGQTVALVGPSGGGKSTLSELLPRFYDPTAGEILIDGVSLRD